MKHMGEMLTQHKNAFLLGLLLTTLIVSGYANRERLLAASATVEIPVTDAAAKSLNALDAYRMQRDQDTRSDISALEKLCALGTLDEKTRQDAAEQLQEMIDNRKTQSALEGALTGSSLYPCIAVVSGRNVTIVTEKDSITEKDSALVLTLAQAHAGASPENVRIITTK